MRILLVDDTFSNRQVAELMLRHAGHRVVSASHGEEAIQLAKETPVDVILMDLHMPGMDGWQTTEAIRRQERQRGASKPVPIIALTAYAVAGTRERCLATGMDDFLAKPIDRQRLIETVERHGQKR